MTTSTASLATIRARLHRYDVGDGCERAAVAHQLVADFAALLELAEGLQAEADSAHDSGWRAAAAHLREQGREWERRAEAAEDPTERAADKQTGIQFWQCANTLVSPHEVRRDVKVSSLASRNLALTAALADLLALRDGDGSWAEETGRFDEAQRVLDEVRGGGV